jgi:hypothetical protein
MDTKNLRFKYCESEMLKENKKFQLNCYKTFDINYFNFESFE